MNRRVAADFAGLIDARIPDQSSQIRSIEVPRHGAGRAARMRGFPGAGGAPAHQHVSPFNIAFDGPKLPDFLLHLGTQLREIGTDALARFAASGAFLTRARQFLDPLDRNAKRRKAQRDLDPLGVVLGVNACPFRRALGPEKTFLFVINQRAGGRAEGLGDIADLFS